MSVVGPETVTRNFERRGVVVLGCAGWMDPRKTAIILMPLLANLNYQGTGTKIAVREVKLVVVDPPAFRGNHWESLCPVLDGCELGISIIAVQLHDEEWEGVNHA